MKSRLRVQRLRPDIRVNLVVPSTRLGVGIFSIDPLEQLLGMSLEDLLGPLMVASRYQRPAGARALDVYPLALPDGEGAAIPLGGFGEVGFEAERGMLHVTAPQSASAWMSSRLGQSVVRGPVHEHGVVSYWLRFAPGSAVALPLGGLGEVRLEAA